MLLSDVIGGLGALVMAVPPLKDQFYRFERERQRRLATNSPWPGLRQAAVTAWEEKRDHYDGFDSLGTALGALTIVISFALKMADL